MNHIQNSLSRRLHALFVTPVLVGTTLLVAFSTLRMRLFLRSPRVGVSSDVADALMREQFALEVIEGAALAVVLALAGAWIARHLTRELSAVVTVAERIGTQHFDERIDERSRLGLERLPAAVNAMSARLAQAQQEVAAAALQTQDFNQRLAHAQSLAAVGEVAASIAHEVGSPLNAILISARMAAEEPECPERYRETLTRIAEQSDRIGAVLRRMLRLSQPATEEKSVGDVRAAIREVLALLGPQCRAARIDARDECDDRTPLLVSMSSARLQQLLFNLALNAIQAQPGGGTLVLCARLVDGAPTVEVRDAGPGVAPDASEAIWEPFFTSRRSTGGTGLGLSVVKSLVDRSGATIEVDRAPEGGARFRIRFAG